MKYIISLLLFINSAYFFAQDEEKDFNILDNNEHWNLVFKDNCKNDWTNKWTLDGLIAKVENSNKGMHFKAGPKPNDDAHHAVLWTKESFAGDVKIEFDYTRTDTENRYVNILYIQATGDQDTEVYDKDILKWSDLRTVPAMRNYFNNMNLLHISFAAFKNDGGGAYYVRARKYPKNTSFEDMRIQPSYDMDGYMKSNQKYHITAIKRDKALFFKVESVDGVKLFFWDLSKIPPIKEGRIGIRHMATRSAIYKNFKVYTN
ncbi:protein of unknown function [Lutibacter agarilyticus]|uniref:DUF1961 domain-containing protein n=1 Tax=Lutibacter agarilyticus TaxID=1109740 RepID=A0A238Y401_9FLAO|nr:DUF1961 family protein [Lutibacter agarilyticus]SNR66006.1 protein of unknown function [Lutibacter agarilyticus]